MIDINKILTTQSNTLDIVLHFYSVQTNKNFRTWKYLFTNRNNYNENVLRLKSIIS